MNAGDKLTAPTTTTNGAYTQGGGAGGGTSDRFVAASGTPFSGATVGDYVSVYNDGATTPAFIGRISAVNSSTSIDVDSTKFSGTRPTTVGTGKTATLGGAWLGPVGAVGHPFNFITTSATDGSGNAPRVNGVGTSNITAAMTHANAGSIRFQGMTSAPGDGGKWTIDGGTSGTSFTLLTVTGAGLELVDLVFQNNGASGSSRAIDIQANSNRVARCVFHNLRGTGIRSNSPNNVLFDEVEIYACNQSNTASIGCLELGAGSVATRCTIHNNTGSNVVGVRTTHSASILSSVIESNGLHGIEIAAAGVMTLAGVDLYNNGGDGIRDSLGAGTVLLYVENCNLVKNGGYGINRSGVGAIAGTCRNCGFGSGTQANTSGTTMNLGSTEEIGSITYASGVTPWVDPDNGDFRISLAAAKAAGRGAFTETATGYAGTVAYPDIGAAQSKGGGGLPLGRTVGGL